MAKNYTDIIELSFGLCELVLCFMYYTKLLILFYYHKSLSFVIDELEDIWNEAENSKILEWKNLNEIHQKNTRKNTLLFVGWYGFSSLVYSLIPYSTTVLKVLYSGWPSDNQTYTYGTHQE